MTFSTYLTGGSAILSGDTFSGGQALSGRLGSARSSAEGQAINGELSAEGRSGSGRSSSHALSPSESRMGSAFSSSARSPEETMIQMRHVMEKNRGAKVIGEMLTIMVRTLNEAGMLSPDAVRLANQISREVLLNWGGSMIYFPKPDCIDRSFRNANILAEFTGRNHRRLAAKYGCSVSLIYKLVQAQQQERARLRREAAGKTRA